LMTYKAILFDLDGTLLDSVQIILEAAGEVCDAMGLDFDEADFRKSIGIPLRVQALRWAGSRAEEFRDRYRAIYRELQEERAVLFPGTAEMLAEIKARGSLTGVVTSKSTRSTLRALEHTGILAFFDTIVTADDVVHHKPHPDPILKALESLGLRSDEALYIGDSMFDVEAAQAAGVEVVGVSWGARSREDLLLQCPNGVFDTWAGFLSWLDGGPSH